MKKRLAVWVFFIILSLTLSLTLSLEPSFAPGLAPGLMAQPGLGAASIAKGGVSLGEGDPFWALWNDPSGLIGADQTNFPALLNAFQFNYSINEIAFEFIKTLIPELDIVYVNNGFRPRGLPWKAVMVYQACPQHTLKTYWSICGSFSRPFLFSLKSYTKNYFMVYST